ncbi:MAG: VanZ family protein, partial [Clostridia bacterium]|nr:VanZ family protein [Clostridia bacterium]
SFLNSFEKILREAAHFVIFLFLGFFVHGTAVKFKKKSSDKAVVFSLFFCTLYAFLDEFHQFFVSGRTAQSVDLVIDFLGAFLGMKIFSFIYLKYKNNNSKPM